MTLVNYEVQNSIATLTLNAPDQLNAMSLEMGLEFKDRLKHIANDSTIRVVILKGAGRAFSSGGNLDMLLEKIQKSPEQNAKDLKSFYQLFLGVRDLPQPVIAEINGHAVGAGFCLALACDLRYASSKAKLGATFAKIGLAPGMGGTYLITRLAGPVNAAKIMFTGQIFEAPAMLDMGLLNEVVDPNELSNTVQTVAQQIAANGPLSVKIIKKGIQKAQHQSLQEMFDYDSQSQAECFATHDILEGINATKEKRPPEFKGS